MTNQSRPFDIADVADLCRLEPVYKNGAPVVTGSGEHWCVCPFCGDKRGKFSYVINRGNKKNYYGCFVCGEHGNMFDLWREMNPFGKTYGDNDAKAMARDIYRAMDNPSYTPVERHVREEQTSPDVKRLDDETLSKNHLMVMKQLTLTDEHKRELLRRGFTDEDISRLGFRSSPDYAEAKKIADTLITKGRTLEGDPWFFEYTDRQGHSFMTMRVTPGIILPIWHENLLVSAQVYAEAVIRSKLDPKNVELAKEAEGVSKYMHLSTSGRPKGTSSGSESSFLPGKRRDIVIVAEGTLKALLAYSACRGEFSFVGVPGINAQTGLDSVMRYIPKNAVIFEAFDMDQRRTVPDATPENTAKILAMYPDKAKEGMSAEQIVAHERAKALQVSASAKKLIARFQAAGFITVPLVWDTDKNGNWNGNYKGIDDILVAGYAEVMKKFVAHKAESARNLAELAG